MTETLTSILCQTREVRLSSKELGTVVILGLTDSCVSTYCSWTKYHKVDNGLSKSPAKWTEDNTRNISTNSWQRATPTLLSQHEPFQRHITGWKRGDWLCRSALSSTTHWDDGDAPDGRAERITAITAMQLVQLRSCVSPFIPNSNARPNGYCADSTSLRENTLRLESKCFSLQTVTSCLMFLHLYFFIIIITTVSYG